MKTGFFLPKIWKITKNQGLNLPMKSEGTLMCQINVYARLFGTLEYEKIINFNYLLNKSLDAGLLTQWCRNRGAKGATAPPPHIWPIS